MTTLNNQKKRVRLASYGGNKESEELFLKSDNHKYFFELQEDAVMGVFCRRWGVPLMDGGTIRLPRLIGLSRALDLILTGRAVSAREAHDMGLVNRVVGRGKSREAAEQLAAEIGSFPQLCMKGDRASAYEQNHLSVPDALQNEWIRGLPAVTQEAWKGATVFAQGKGSIKCLLRTTCSSSSSASCCDVKPG